MGTTSQKLHERIAELREGTGLSQRDFGEKVGVSKQAVYQWEKGKRQPSTDLLDQLADAFGVSRQWLHLGEGEMQPASTDVTNLRTVGWPERFADTFTLTIRREVRPSAGTGNIVYEVETVEVDQLQESKQLFKDLLGFWPPDDMEGLYVDGDSMGEELNRQLVLLQPVEQLTSGKRFVLLLEDEQTGDWQLVLKRVFLHPGGGIRIISDNKALGIPDVDLLPNGSEKHFINKETGLPVRVQVVGRVLWPSEEEEAEQMRLITRTIERLAEMGYRLPGGE